MIAVRPALTAIVLTLTVAIASACDRAATAPTVEGLTIHATMLEDDTGFVVYSHADHWHGIPVVGVGADLRLKLYFSAVQTAPDDHDAPPRDTWFTLREYGEYDVRVVIEDPAIAEWVGDKTSGALRGRSAGASRVTYVVRHKGATIYEAPPLNFRVR